MPRSLHSLRHARVGTQYYDTSWSGRSDFTCPGLDTVYDMRCFNIVLLHVPGWDAVIQHAMIMIYFYGMPWSGAFLQYALVGTWGVI